MERLAPLEETIQFWQPQYSRSLTVEDARQMVENVTGFFTTLQRWSVTADASQLQPNTDKEAA